jgi:hypothetical protein
LPHAYGNLYVYDFSRRTVTRLTDRAAAQAYFDRLSKNRNGGCPPGEAGYGVTLL